jgi:hypothetical protein
MVAVVATVLAACHEEDKGKDGAEQVHREQRQN